MGKFLAEIVELYPVVYAIHKLILCGKAKIIIIIKEVFFFLLAAQNNCAKQQFLGTLKKIHYLYRWQNSPTYMETEYISVLKFLNLIHYGLKTSLLPHPALALFYKLLGM